MKYIVETVKTTKNKNKKFRVVCPEIESREDWIYEAYLLKSENCEDIVVDFLDRLETFKVSVVERGSYVDYRHKKFVGISTIKAFFKNKEEAQKYADYLNEKL